MMTDDLVAHITATLQNEPGLKARAIARRLGVRTRQVNPILYRRRDLFEGIGEPPPSWFRRDSVTVTTMEVFATPRSFSSLYLWQREAFRAWQANGNRGIVEAVTGAGKSELALAAMDVHLERRGKVAIIVPGIDLARQWEQRVRERFPATRVGVMGGGRKGTLAAADVVVALVQSASARLLELDDDRGLLVADEVHRYATKTYNLALEPGFEARLGLTATLARDDGAHESLLLPYFGSIAFTLGYDRALADDVIAPYTVALMGVDLTVDERAEYERQSRSMASARRRLVDEYVVRSSPFRDFMTDTTTLARHGDRQAGIVANRWLKACRDRRAVLAEASGKMAALASFIPSLRSADRSLVFTETIDAAQAIATRLHSAGLSVAALHSEVPRRNRHATLAEFAAGRVRCVVAPRILDEGIDVPEADLAVVLAASRSRRQMVQRMGRVLRRKEDGRRARFAIVYVNGSSDDPFDAAYEGQHDELLDAADDEETFSPDEAAALTAFLAPHV